MGLSPTEVVTLYQDRVRRLRECDDSIEEYEVFNVTGPTTSLTSDLHGQILNLRSENHHQVFLPTTFNAEGLFCPIELEHQSAQSGRVLRCGHCFNRAALREYAKTCAEEGNVSCAHIETYVMCVRSLNDMHVSSLSLQLPLRCPNHADKCPFIFSWEETMEVLLGGGESEDRLEIEERLIVKLAARVAPRSVHLPCFFILLQIFS